MGTRPPRDTRRDASYRGQPRDRDAQDWDAQDWDAQDWDEQGWEAEDTGAPSRGARSSSAAESSEPATDAGVGRAPGILRRRPLALGAITGLAICALALATLLVVGSQSAGSPPDDQAQTLCASLMKQDYPTVYALLTPQLQQRGSQAQFIASQRELDTLRGPVTACDAHRREQADARAGQYTYTLTVTRTLRGAPSHNDGYAQFVRVGNDWKIGDYDSGAV